MPSIGTYSPDKELQTTRRKIDWTLLLAIAGLLSGSVAFVYSASAYFADVRFGDTEKLFFSHLIRVVMALVVILLTARIDYRAWARFSTLGMVAAVFFLVYVLIAGTEIKGATRWIYIGGFINFQPSEFAKFALILHLSVILSVRADVIKKFKSGFLPMLLWTSVICGLVALQPNFSTAAVIGLIAFLLMYIGSANLLHLGTLAIVGGFGAYFYAISAEYRLRRIQAFLGMGDSTDAVYQLQQAILAFANGGWIGVGPGNSMQRNWFLPESYSDFIFSIIGEEYGFIGVLFLLGMFGLIIARGFRIAFLAPDDFGRNLAFGITLTIGIYALLNAGITTGLLPTTGLPMPFISYGGTSILFSAAAAGILLNISSHIRQPNSGKKSSI